MLDPTSVEKGYDGYMERERAKFHYERHTYWKDKAVELNAENIELKILRAQDLRRTKLHAICVTVGATLLLIAVFMPHG
jgi:hypothetical protein